MPYVMFKGYAQYPDVEGDELIQGISENDHIYKKNIIENGESHYQIRKKTTKNSDPIPIYDSTNSEHRNDVFEKLMTILHVVVVDEGD